MTVSHSHVRERIIDTHQEAFSHVVERIAAAPIIRDPYPYIYVKDIFPSAYYQAMLQRIVDVGEFAPAVYPGVGVDLTAANFRDHGLTCENLASDPWLSAFHNFLKSELFTRPLLERFSAPDSWGERGPAIPAEKHRYFANGQTDFTSVFDLHKDMAGYEITPHPDIPSKIITYLFYLTPDESLRQFGTMLCRPKKGVKQSLQDREAASRISRAVAKLTKRFSGPYGLDQKEGWLPWEDFDITAMAEALPNSFFAFAPNDLSFHAVRMNIPADAPVQERLTLRGFIRSSHDSTNWKAEYTNTLGRRLSFGIARLVRSS
jgi:hypothetical protein